MRVRNARVITLGIVWLIGREQAFTAEPPPRPDAELKLLQPLIGVWTSETTVTNLGGEAVEKKSTGEATRKWALSGRIVEETAHSSNGDEIRVIFTYDAIRKTYRWFYFSSAGFNVESTGKWDEATQTFTFHADLGGGSTQDSTIRIIDNDHHEWTSKAIRADGKVVFEGNGKLQRKL